MREIPKTLVAPVKKLFDAINDSLKSDDQEVYNREALDLRFKTSVLSITRAVNNKDLYVGDDYLQQCAEEFLAVFDQERLGDRAALMGGSLAGDVQVSGETVLAAVYAYGETLLNGVFPQKEK